MTSTKIFVVLAATLFIASLLNPQQTFASFHQAEPCLSSSCWGQLLSPFVQNGESQTEPKSQTVVFTQFVPDGIYVSHTVKSNETLQSIAQDYYSNKAYWTDLWNDNPSISDPNKLSVGLLLRVRVLKPKKPEILVSSLQNRMDALNQQAQEQSEIASWVQPPSQITLQSYPQSSFDSVYKAAGARFGVPWQILYGIHMTETGGRNGPIFSHYGTGAEGPMQFMPGTFNAYAVDARGNGKPDINDAVDAIYTAANFLAKHGSIMAGLESYGGNTQGVLALARARGYTE